jgi:hypothetical protein
MKEAANRAGLPLVILPKHLPCFGIEEVYARTRGA